ncbi:hypothetical protein ZIOFF_029502 [Zingiber officinale]|uniref:Uncharacterized protein n=1 Tax=Zingiber officinale TaxID=94328 RepID=A0A8J5GXS0_ZINOF|nr:hypothetical protein ZIOFF_029502 [Zingiber officinale]
MGLCGVPLPECLVMKLIIHHLKQEEMKMMRSLKDSKLCLCCYGIHSWILDIFGRNIHEMVQRITLFRMVDKMYDWMHMQLSLKLIIHPPSQAGGDEEDDEKFERVLNYAFVCYGIHSWILDIGVISMKMSTRITLFRMVDMLYDWMYVQLSLKFGSVEVKKVKTSLSH